MVKVIKIQAKEIFTKTKLPGADWVINQYVGCEHQCLYCYAKFIGKWKPKSYGVWGKWVEAKINAPELVHPVKCRKAAISPQAKLFNRVNGKSVEGSIFMSSISDPYQPIEKELKLTRQILENLDKDVDLSILTKSDLVIRDIGLFKKFKNISVGLTINGFGNKEKEIFEPFSSTNAARIKALKVLKDNRIANYAFVSPIIPGLIDLQDIIGKTKGFVDSYWFEFINLRGAGKEFAEVLKKQYPQVRKILQDKKLFADFIDKCKSIIKSANIKVQDMVLHN